MLPFFLLINALSTASTFALLSGAAMAAYRLLRALARTRRRNVQRAARKKQAPRLYGERLLFVLRFAVAAEVVHELAKFVGIGRVLPRAALLGLAERVGVGSETIPSPYWRNGSGLVKRYSAAFR